MPLPLLSVGPAGGPSPLLVIAAVVVLGIGAQWLAWRTKFPSILLLLGFGFLAGPITGFLPQSALQGDWLFPFASLSVGIILFEGGLTLRFDEFKEVGRAVVNLITVGVLITGVLGTLGAHYLAGFTWEVAVVLGALLTVTGPTVVLPLLRHVRPAGRVGTIAKWEGITIDPIGAILAVLVLEAVILINEPAEAAGTHESVWGALATGLAFEVVVGVGVAVLAAGLLIVLLQRRLVPDWLQNPVALMVVVAAFAVSNSLQEEAGLLEATLLGIIMANQKYVSVRRIVEFKEDLRVLLISLLFIVLSARLDPSAFAIMLSPGPLLFLAALMLVIRPLAVAVSALGTGLTWKEQGFLAWLAPRGIVAAAVASLFSFRLAEFFPADAERIVPVVFLVIVGTVAVYGLTISPLARWLGLAMPDPQGILFIGAQGWVRRVAAALQNLGVRVLLVDANARNVRQSRKEGLPAQRANILAEGVIDDLDMSGDRPVAGRHAQRRGQRARGAALWRGVRVRRGVPAPDADGGRRQPGHRDPAPPPWPAVVLHRRHLHVARRAVRRRRRRPRRAIDRHADAGGAGGRVRGRRDDAAVHRARREGPRVRRGRRDHAPARRRARAAGRRAARRRVARRRRAPTQTAAPPPAGPTAAGTAPGAPGSGQPAPGRRRR